MKKYRCSIEIVGDIEAPNVEEAKKKFADKLSDDYFSFFDPSDVNIVNEEEVSE